MFNGTEPFHFASQFSETENLYESSEDFLPLAQRPVKGNLHSVSSPLFVKHCGIGHFKN